MTVTTTEWIEIGTAAITIIGIIVHVERRMGKALTREEHEEICKQRNDRVEKQIGEMRAEQDRRHLEGVQERNRLHAENRESLSEIRNDIRTLMDRL